MSIVSIIIAIIIFSVIVIFHELGHFSLAKANGIQVNEFSLGLGPTIIGFTKGETKYSIKLLPFGGACMMEGEDDKSDNPKAFPNKSVWARIAVVFAGPFFNFIMAFIGAFIIISCVGFDKATISDVIPGYAAEEAGMQGGDTIIALNGHSIHFYREVSAYSTFHEGQEVEITYLRDGAKHKTILTPKLDEESGRYLYGFIGNFTREKGTIIQGIRYSFYEVKYWIYTTIQSLRLLIVGNYGVRDLSGPVGIVRNMGDVYEESVTNDGYFYAFLNMLNWVVLLSANLGVMNLLPLPALDGGRLVFLILEAIRGKRIDPEKEGMVHGVGIIILLLLMCFVMFNDIKNIFIH